MKRNFLIFQLWCLLFIFSEKSISQQVEEYIVKKGDNLWRIARIYQATEKEIMELNGMNSSVIKPGQVVLIPREKKFSIIISSSQIKEKIAKDTKDVEVNIEEVRHYVKEGENLWSISRKYGVKVEEIKGKNNIISTSIKPGETLLIPAKTTSIVAFENIKPLPDINKVNIENIPLPTGENFIRHKVGHYVKEGDSLWSISRRYGLKTEEIKTANNLSGNLIKPGETLLIPAKTTSIVAFENIKPLPDINKVNIENIPLPRGENFIRHKVRYRESLWDISQRYKTKPEEIKTANNLSGNLIKPGETLLIPAHSIEEPLPKKITKRKSNRPEKRKEESVITEEELKKIKEERSKIVVLASRYLGVRYRWGGTTTSGFDCSGFVKHVYFQVGENLPRSAKEQFNVGTPIEKSELKPGDRVFFTTYRRGPSHVGIYIGGGKFIHASSKRGSRYVKIDDLNSAFYTRKYIGAKRPSEKFSD